MEPLNKDTFGTAVLAFVHVHFPLSEVIFYRVCIRTRVLSVCVSFTRSRGYTVQVLKGSHKLGRINHEKVGGQMGADMERVEHVKKVRAEYCESRYREIVVQTCIAWLNPRYTKRAHASKR